MFAGLFWLATAYSMVQIHFVGFGSTNIIVYDHELGDWYGDIPVFYLTASIFIMMMIKTFYQVFLQFREGGEDMLSGRRLDQHIVGERR